jgi:hypothetical protein
MQAFRRAIETSFQPVARELGASWQVVCPWIEGFSTDAIQVTIGVYHGHSPNVCVKLRPSAIPAPLGSDEGAFGLDWVQAFVAGHLPPYRPEQHWRPDTITAEVETLAAQFRHFALPLITTPTTDWSQIQRYVRAGVEASLADSDQAMEPGLAAEYVANFIVEGTASWVAIELFRRFLKSGRIERWAPVFTCGVPPELQVAIDAAAPSGRYFQFWFHGIPTEKGRYGRDGQCLREVCIQHVSRIIEGRDPTSV